MEAVLNRGIYQNFIYLIIYKALELRKAVDKYAFKLRLFKDVYNIEIYEQDYIKVNNWVVL